MKLPPDSIIARSKITHYLLVPQPKGDKSAFLALAGYDLSKADSLISDLRSQVLPCDAEELERNVYGQFYAIRAALTGPNGRVLRTRTIWIKEHLSLKTKFVTLIPERSRPHDL